MGPRDKPEDDIDWLGAACFELQVRPAGISFPVHNVCRRRMTRGAECAFLRVPRRCGGGSGTVVVKEPGIAVRKPLRAGRQTSGAPVHGARMF